MLLETTCHEELLCICACTRSHTHQLLSEKLQPSKQVQRWGAPFGPKCQGLSLFPQERAVLSQLGIRMTNLTGFISNLHLVLRGKANAALRCHQKNNLQSPSTPTQFCFLFVNKPCTPPSRIKS